MTKYLPEKPCPSCGLTTEHDDDAGFGMLGCLDRPNFEGHDPRECDEHRTVGPHRAWCFDCGEWCYPSSPCIRCEAPKLRKEAPAVPVGQLRSAIKLLWPEEMTPYAKRLLEQICEQHGG